MGSIEAPSTTDYLIIGGGTAGLVVASRLSEDPNVHVTVLESGRNLKSNPLVKDPRLWRSLKGSDVDWDMKIEPQVRQQSSNPKH